MIETTQRMKAYGKQTVVDKVSLHIKKGRIYGASLDMGEADKVLIMQNVNVISSGLCSDTLEDYLKKITGGEGVA